MVYVAFIFYGCLIPFQYSGFEQLAANLGRVSWIPFVDADGSRASIPDVVQNILFFMPFGFLGFLNGKSQSRDRVVKLGALAFLLSGCVETLQLLTFDRTTSPTDVVTNMLGAVFGAGVAWSCMSAAHRLPQRWRNDWMQRESFFLLSAATATVVVSMSQPFDFALDVGMLRSRLKSFLREPLSFSGTLRDEGVVWMQFALLGYAARLFFGEIRRVGAWKFALAFSVLLGIALEATQLIITSRYPGARDLTVVVTAAIAGVVVYHALHSRLTRRTGIALVSLATVIAAAMHALSPFEFRSPMQGLNWIPFLAYYERTSFVALSNFVESMLVYLPLAFVAQYLFRTQNVLVNVAIVVAVCAGLLEFLQGFVEGRYPDVTDILGALAGVLVGCWVADSHREFAAGQQRY